MTSLEASANVPAIAGLTGQNSALDPLGPRPFIAPDFRPGLSQDETKIQVGIGLPLHVGFHAAEHHE